MFIQLDLPTKAVANNLSNSNNSEKIHHQPVKFKVAVQPITITEDHGLQHQISNSNNSVLL